MIYLTIYLYLIGSTITWWYARSTNIPMAGKVVAVVGWPVIVPLAALLG